MKSTLNPNRKGSCKKMIPGLIGAHLLGCVISIVASSLLGRFENEYITLAMYALCLLFGLFFYYHEGWSAGSSDKLYIDNKQISFTPWKGVKVGVYASVLNFAVALLGFLSTCTPLGGWQIMEVAGFQLIYRLWFWAFSWFFNAIKAYPILHFLPVLAMPAACGVGYVLGVKQLRLADYLFYKRDNK